MPIDRRRFLTYLGAGTYAALTRPRLGLASPRRCVAEPPGFFTPIGPSREDRLVLAPELEAKSHLVVGWGDPLGSTGPLGSEAVGFNADFTAFFPLDALSGGTRADEGLLWVNHEYPDPVFVSGYAGGAPKSVEQIRAEKLSVGGTLLHVRREEGRWRPVVGSPRNRRVTALYPEIALTGPTAAHVPLATGSLANCSGGTTPWNTVLSCEENYPDYNDPKGYRWSDQPGHGVDERQYGWVLEVDPFGELPPRKHSALGRFKHENTALRISPTSRQVVIYMGDDEQDQFVYKYVSAEAHDPTASRESCRRLLQDGTLYAADFAQGAWLPLDLKDPVSGPRLRAAEFATQADVLLRARAAAKALGATPVDRCEDCEVHPRDGSVYIALTNNVGHGNLYGQIVRLLEHEDRPEGTRFSFEIFLAGGPQTGLACPDNLAFDRDANLWVACDIGSAALGKGAYAPFGNNGLFVVPTTGPSAGCAFQVASGPVGSELTGPWFTPDQETLFLAVQHPGEGSKSLEKATSRWPDGGTSAPRPSVVAVQGFRW